MHAWWSHSPTGVPPTSSLSTDTHRITLIDVVLIRMKSKCCMSGELSPETRSFVAAVLKSSQAWCCLGKHDTFADLPGFIDL